MVIGRSALFLQHTDYGTFFGVTSHSDQLPGLGCSGPCVPLGK